MFASSSNLIYVQLFDGPFHREEFFRNSISYKNSFLSFNVMKNVTSYTGGVLIDNQSKELVIDNLKYSKLSKIDIFKKALFVLIIQLLNTKVLLPIFLIIVKYSYKYSFNFFLKKYRTDFEVSIKGKFPIRFSSLMHPFQKKILLDQFDDIKEKQLSRIRKSEIYFKNLKEIKYLIFSIELL